MIKKSSFSDRIHDISPFVVVDFITRAQALEDSGRDIINLAVGEPDFPTPYPIVDAGMEALRGSNIKYTPSLGTPELRSAIAKWYREKYKIAVDPNRIAVTSGSSAALVLVMGILLRPDSTVLMADPGYPPNRNIVRAMEGRALNIPVGPDTGYQLTADLIKKHWSSNTVAAIVASPSNPTGTVVAGDELRQMSDVVKEKGGAFIVDEIYQGITFKSGFETVLKFTDDIYVINSFSKYFGMTGWRLGWVVAPQVAIPLLEKLAQNLYISNSDIAQKAAMGAFSDETFEIAESHRKKYKQQRDFLLKRLRSMGFSIPVDPDGAFYIYANCSKFTNNSYDFCVDILENTGVAIAPGADFGDYQANIHVRFSYPKPIEILDKGTARLAEYLEALSP